MKRHVLKLLSVCIGVLLSFNFGNALISDSHKKRIDAVIIKIENRLEPFSDKRKAFIYSSLKGRLGEKTTDSNKEVIAYILSKIEELESKSSEKAEVILEELTIKTGEDVTENEISVQATKIDSKLSFTRAVTPHNSVILRFTRGGNHMSVIDAKKNSIENGNSIFIFRNGSSDLSISDIQTITSQLQALNPEVLIFIDQEGGLVNRYVDFESLAQVQKLFDDEYVASRMNVFQSSEKTILRSLFPQNYGYFPSLGRIGVAYDSFVSDTSKKNFVEIIAYIRLKTLSDNGINTYGFVADLNLGNPAITNASRSFSKHVNKYKVLVDAFIGASEQTGVSLYLKHFPGHGAGLIDSHKGILNLTNQPGYLTDNIELFDYFLDNKLTPGGLMVGHIIVPDSLREGFTETISKSDYILTDDLAMQGYKKMTDVKPQGGFFSSHAILQNTSLIKVDTQYVESVY